MSDIDYDGIEYGEPADITTASGDDIQVIRIGGAIGLGVATGLGVAEVTGVPDARWAAIPVETTPAAAVRDALAHAMGRVIYLRAKEAALGDDLVWGTSKKVARTGAGQAGQPTMEVHQEAGIHVYSRLLMDAEDRLAAIAAAMLRAGIEQRRARVDEQLVDQFRRVTDGMLARLDLSPATTAGPCSPSRCRPKILKSSTPPA
jgi:hypothetical protein